MKKLMFLSLLFMSFNLVGAQEWFTSFEVAKRMALIQNKLLFVVWEDDLNQEYPLLINTKDRKRIKIDLSQNVNADSLIWEHFIPVLLPEYLYSDLILETKKGKRSLKYIDKLNDYTIKIMDANTTILNLKTNTDDYQNLSEIIEKYALNTAFLHQELKNYSETKNFNTALKLGAKYSDFAMFVDKSIRREIMQLATIYLNEAKQLLLDGKHAHKPDYLQRVELLQIKQQLILAKPRKARRLLKGDEYLDISEINTSLHSMLKYVTFKLSNEEDQAKNLKEVLPLASLKKAELILNINNK